MTPLLTPQELDRVRRLSSNGQPVDPELVLRLVYERDALSQLCFTLEVEIKQLRAEVNP